MEVEKSNVRAEVNELNISIYPVVNILQNCTCQCFWWGTHQCHFWRCYLNGNEQLQLVICSKHYRLSVWSCSDLCATSYIRAKSGFQASFMNILCFVIGWFWNKSKSNKLWLFCWGQVILTIAWLIYFKIFVKICCPWRLLTYAKILISH